MDLNSMLNNDALKGIDMQKIMMLQSALGQTKNKSSNEMLPFLMALSRQANSKGLSFTLEEISLIVGVLKKDMSEEEKAKTDKMLQIIGMMK